MGKLVECRECKHQVSPSAATCPMCGVKDPGKKGGIGIGGLLAVLVVGWIAYTVIGPAMDTTTSTPTTARPSPASSNSPRQCGVADFEIRGFKVSTYDACARTPCPALRLTGELVNNCSLPAGALIKITGKDRNGAVIQTNEGWPASTRNIPPGQAYAFDFGPLFNHSPNMTSFNAEILDARTWRN